MINQDANALNIGYRMMNFIEKFVPLDRNPNRFIYTDSDNYIIVRTQSGSVYTFDSITDTPLFFNNMRIDYQVNDSSGNTIYIIDNNGEHNVYRLDLQGNIIYWVNPSRTTDSSNNHISIPSLHNGYTDSSNNHISIPSLHNGYTNRTAIIPSVIDINMRSVSLFTGSIIKKKITEHEDNVCPIKQEQIEKYDIYMSCDFCNKNFFEHEIRRWLLSCDNENRTCPNCRTIWSNYNMYVNRE
jgi:hypothetical protein